MAVLQLLQPISAAAAATSNDVGSIAIPAAAPAAASSNRTTTRSNVDFSTTPVISNRGVFFPGHYATGASDGGGYQAQIIPANTNHWGNLGDGIIGGGGGGGVLSGAFPTVNMMLMHHQEPPQHQSYSNVVSVPRFQQYQQQSQQLVVGGATSLSHVNDNHWQKTNTTSNHIPTLGGRSSTPIRFGGLADRGGRRGSLFPNNYNNNRGGRIGGGTVGAPPRPPPSPRNSFSFDQQQQQLMRGTTPMRGSPSGKPPLFVQNSHYEEYQHHHGSGGDYYDTSSSIEEPSFMTADRVSPVEVALTTDLVTLSVHDALTFDGVELALHPDLFGSHGSTSSGYAGSKMTVDGKKENGGTKELTNQRLLRPGDLVEIRVWCVRPGMAASVSSVLKPKIKPGTSTTVRPTSLHSRDISHSSALTISPTYSGESPGSLSTTEADSKLVGEHLIFGDHLLEEKITIPKEQAASAVFTSSNLTSVLSGAASSLFRKRTAPATTDNMSVISHSRDSSMTTNNSTATGVVTHSRDSSALTASASWINSLIMSSTSREEIAAQISPPQPQSLITNNESQQGVNINPQSDVLPMRRDHTHISPFSTGPISPNYPLSSSSSGLSPGSKSPPKHPTPFHVSNISSHEQANSPRSSSLLKSISANDTLLPTTILTPDIGDATLPQQRASNANISSSPDLLNNGGAASLHTRHESLARADSSNNYSMTPGHRRYHSNLAAIPSASSDTLSSLPQSVLSGSKYQKVNAPAAEHVNIDVNENINDILLGSHYMRVSFVMPVSEGSLTSIKSGARTQVSLLRQVADLYNITAYDTITITQITRNRAPFVQQAIAADYLTITFKDQFVSRGEMYSFQKWFSNSWVYEGKRLSFNGIRTVAKVIRHGDNIVRSALISEDTKLTFRSRSARIIWLVQMSSEMWDFASPNEAVGNQTSHKSSCKIYFDKFVDFVHRLFNKWKKLQARCCCLLTNIVTHCLTVVFFSRTYIRHLGEETDEKTTSAVHVDTDGRMFVDHYKIVLENEVNAGNNLIHRMKQEFIKYPKEVRWNLIRGNERTPSTASQGNVLEAINMSLNLLYLHYIDRDVHRTGNSIVVITPGNGVFEIDKDLAGITKQRMMDNGIGSDVLSLGLPPLHVAPFFLYKEKGASSVEEIQGFDDWKTYFEVPHWMNLSFVDYDHEEDPKWYKENANDGADNVNQIAEENETLAQTWSASNGFMKRRIPDSFCAPKIQPTQVNSTRQHYKHLITDRGFEDILQACRPRFRGEYGFGLPESLTNLIQKFSPGKNLDLDQDAPLDNMRCLTSRSKNDSSRSRYLEWGALDFDDFQYKRISDPRQTSSRNHSQPSNRTSTGSHMFDRPLSNSFDISHLQSTLSLDGGGHSMSSGGGDSLASRHGKTHSSPFVALDHEGTEKGCGRSIGKDCSLSEIQKLMTDRDMNIFSITPKDRAKSSDISHSFVEDGHRNTVNQSFRPGSPTFEGRGVLRSQSSFITALKKGGIEAALVQYDVTSQNKEGSLLTPGVLDTSKGQDDEAESSSLSLVVPPSPLGLGGMPVSLDRRNEGLRPSSMKLVAHDVTRAARFSDAADGFQPLELQRKNYSFHFLSQSKIRTRDDVYNQSKTPGENAKQNRLDQRRKSQWDTPKDSGSKFADHSAKQEIGTAGDHRLHTQSSSQQRVKTVTQHNRKPHQHQSHRHRRQPWVLNPFRQEDEEEVLSKRTHNRRRWSHVFPLGEDEFKRHAGPNWKSLCQPAILPMTIDFHPSPQDLEDKNKFSVKQYSVTLPYNMEETTYKSHKELLDALLMQRMRQDYQIVPRTIIQKSARRDITDHNILEATLSMGHKIQRLSYNSSTDSVDVVQYYARFAEDETPQTYHYLMWSSLQQDYVSVFQTFTKYTLPYKWNELDMLISGDAVTNIVEGMRQPRISFVIIPDPFVDSHGENDYLNKFQRLVEYLGKLHSKKDEAHNFSIEIVATSSDAGPKASSGDKRFVVDLRKKRDEKYEWMELVHDSNCDTRRTFRLTIQWLVCVASKIDQQAQLLHRRCSQYGLKLVNVPHFSCLRSCFLNPFAVSITKRVLDRRCVDAIEKALTNDFNFVYDGNHMSDPNEIDFLDGFEFSVNKWSIKKRKAFVPARQYLHRTGTLFTRLLRDKKGSAIVILYLNNRHIAGDVRLLDCAREVFHRIEHFIEDVETESKP